MFRSLFRPVLVGRLFGIPLLVMPAVLLLTLAILFSAFHAADGPGIGALLLLLAILGLSLVAHELGHALVARRLGLRVLDITIWPLGGMARLEGLYRKPEVEAPVALAGPVVNLALAGIFALLPGNLAHDSMGMNLVLGVGNLFPAFPLDGGRVLRAWLSRRSPLPDATRAAIRISSWVAAGLCLYTAFFHMFFFGLILLVYVWFTGRMELLQVILRTGQAPRLSTGSVFRAAFGHGPTRTPGPNSETWAREKDLEEDLQDFHGSLNEFFRDRDPKD